MTDRLNQPIEYRYPSDDRPRTAPADRLPDDGGEWRNCWDYHPYQHGGRFVRWNGHEWDVIDVTPPSAWPESEHIFEAVGVQPSDIWEDPSDPMTDWSDRFKRSISGYRDPPVLPNAEPVFDRLAAYVGDFAANYCRGRSETVECPDRAAYWDMVTDYGVDPADLQHVDRDGIPDKYLTDD